MTSPAAAKDKIIVPLDVPTSAEAVNLVEELRGVVSFFKIGLELFTSGGPGVVAAARRAGGSDCRVFLDLKLHDIPNTVRQAVRSAVDLGVDMLTVHLSGGGAMLRAAVEGAGERTLLLGVSVLTSSDQDTLAETGVAGSIAEQVNRLAALGLRNGLRGVVASPLEAADLRALGGNRLTIVTPGVRPLTNRSMDDQSRVLSPREALQAGADYLVIGRPITAQPDPARAAQQIVEEMLTP